MTGIATTRDAVHLKVKKDVGPELGRKKGMIEITIKHQRWGKKYVDRSIYYNNVLP